MDLHSKVTVDNKEERARYGGSIVNPEAIKEDVAIKIRLKNDAGLNTISTTVCRTPSASNCSPAYATTRSSSRGFSSATPS